VREKHEERDEAGRGDQDKRSSTRVPSHGLQGRADAAS
jgi:hypothetical protein